MDILCTCGHEMSIGTFHNNFFDMCHGIMCDTCDRIHEPMPSHAFVYMAMPYSVGNADSVERERRYQIANELAAKLMEFGYSVFSPITHSHPISKHMSNSKDHQFWLQQDEIYMGMSDGMFIYKGIPEWRDSHGIGYEIGFMMHRNKPVRLFTYEDFEYTETLVTM